MVNYSININNKTYYTNVPHITSQWTQKDHEIWLLQCFSWSIEVEWTFVPVKEYELLDPALSLEDIHILHRGDAQIPIGHLIQ